MLVDQVSEALHALSHGYHNISDIAYELASPPPRQLMAQSLPIYHQAHPPAVVVNQNVVRDGLVGGVARCGRNRETVSTGSIMPPQHHTNNMMLYSSQWK